LREKHRYGDACKKFEDSLSIVPATMVRMHLGLARELNGQLATAWRLFMDVERETREASSDEMKDWHKTVLDRARQIEPRLSKLTINVPPESRINGLTIRRNTEIIDPAMWNSAQAIDGGHYEIIAQTPGRKTWTGEVTIDNERDIKTIEIPRLTPPPPLPPKSARCATTQVKCDDNSTWTLPIAVTGGGGLLLAGAYGFHLWGNSTYKDAQAEQLVQARRDQLEKDANFRRHASIYMGAAGGVVFVCGAAWMGVTWLRGRELDTEARTTGTGNPRVQIVPTVVGDIGLVILGRFL
jgi:hypothetical protein